MRPKFIAEAAAPATNRPHPEVALERAGGAGRHASRRGQGAAAPPKPHEQPGTPAPRHEAERGRGRSGPSRGRPCNWCPRCNSAAGVSPSEPRCSGACAPVGRKVRETWLAQGIRPSANQSCGANSRFDDRSVRCGHPSVRPGGLQPREEDKLPVDRRVVTSARGKGWRCPRHSTVSAGATRALEMGDWPHAGGPPPCRQH